LLCIFAFYILILDFPSRPAITNNLYHQSTKESAKTTLFSIPSAAHTIVVLIKSRAASKLVTNRLLFGDSFDQPGRPSYEYLYLTGLLV
jgi:hypothetical protein